MPLSSSLLSQSLSLSLLRQSLLLDAVGGPSLLLRRLQGEPQVLKRMASPFESADAFGAAWVDAAPEARGGTLRENTNFSARLCKPLSPRC